MSVESFEELLDGAVFAHSSVVLLDGSVDVEEVGSAVTATLRAVGGVPLSSDSFPHQSQFQFPELVDWEDSDSFLKKNLRFLLFPSFW